ncbi:hypothetical protein GDO81_022310 [Engystomops pustulosus]|uniref:Uncharacterized protein n=1 Tax=Engystomops pustulosus TaxID=76066 RepID=A0AAV6YS75_ENGPU|nr:hypothetical protein GDO81_022310 [Engystomops pustulosus]
MAPDILTLNLNISGSLAPRNTIQDSFERREFQGAWTHRPVCRTYRLFHGLSYSVQSPGYQGTRYLVLIQGICTRSLYCALGVTVHGG